MTRRRCGLAYVSIRQHKPAYLEPLILLQEYDEAEVRLRAAGGALELTRSERTWLDPHNLREREGGERVREGVEREREERVRGAAPAQPAGGEREGGGEVGKGGGGRERG
jgi:hypothetical protein